MNLIFQGAGDEGEMAVKCEVGLLRSLVHTTNDYGASDTTRPGIAEPASGNLYFSASGVAAVEFSGFEICTAQPRVPANIVVDPASGATGVALNGSVSATKSANSFQLIGKLPGIYPEWLGDRTFAATHNVRFPMAIGEMATGIATAELVVRAAQSGFLAFFGAGGLNLETVERATAEISGRLTDAGRSWGTNLIHSPYDLALETAVVDLYLRRDVKRISASAFMAMSPAIVRFAANGLSIDAQGRIKRRRHVFAKVSRPEVAAQFMSPAPAEIIAQLLAAKLITATEAQLAARVPVAEDITVEADSGGHTDNRPLVSLLPTVMSLRDTLAERYGYSSPIRVGAAGGLGTPSSVAAAFSLGAAYVMTGSINQSTVEAGTSPAVKQMLAQAELADVAMAPAADMFELGVKVQVLKRGTLFAVRAATLYEAYVEHASLDAIPAALAKQLQQTILRASFDQVWEECAKFWSGRDPHQIVRAEQDPKHKMALVFRWYLGNGSYWARNGDSGRVLDYQVWCGPAMGAFNAWVKGSFLAEPGSRTVAQIGLNLMEGAAVVTRAQQLRSCGIPVSPSAFHFRPRPLR